MNTPHSNIGEEIMALLRTKAEAEWEYFNPHFLSDLNTLIYQYYNVEDEVVEQWICDMFTS